MAFVGSLSEFFLGFVIYSFSVLFWGLHGFLMMLFDDLV